MPYPISRARTGKWKPSLPSTSTSGQNPVVAEDRHSVTKGSFVGIRSLRHWLRNTTAALVRRHKPYKCKGEGWKQLGKKVGVGTIKLTNIMDQWPLSMRTQSLRSITERIDCAGSTACCDDTNSWRLRASFRGKKGTQPWNHHQTFVGYAHNPTINMGA